MCLLLSFETRLTQHVLWGVCLAPCAMPTERRAGLGRIGIRSAKHSDCMPFVAALCVGTCGVLVL
jgi:hypothetical protein